MISGSRYVPVSEDAATATVPEPLLRPERQRGLVVGWNRRAIDRLRVLGARQRLAESASRNAPEEASDAVKDTLHSEQREIVKRALAELPEEQTRILILAYFEGLTQSEIAKKLATPLGTVKTRMRSGMIRLRELLGSELKSIS